MNQLDSFLSLENINFENELLYYNNNENENFNIFEQPIALTSNQQFQYDVYSSSSNINSNNLFDFNSVTYDNNNKQENQPTISDKTDNNKPPLPFADLIVKAILSSDQNQIQLKDIYKYMIDNYEYFSSQADSNRWRNSIRHNLSRHKYFLKTRVKNAQGHFWSIHPSYYKLLKSENVNYKEIKKLKLNSKPRKSKAAILNNTSAISNNSINTINQTPASSTINCLSYNDSAYLSLNETDSSISNDFSSYSNDVYKYKFLNNHNQNQ